MYKKLKQESDISDFERTLVANAIRTPDGTILQSYHRHDYKSYKDKNGSSYAVDGGLDYLKRSFSTGAKFDELSVYSDAPFLLIRIFYHVYKQDENIYVRLCDIPNNWLKDNYIYNDERGNSETFESLIYLTELEYRIKKKIQINDVTVSFLSQKTVY